MQQFVNGVGVQENVLLFGFSLVFTLKNLPSRKFKLKNKIKFVHLGFSGFLATWKEMCIF